MQAERLLLSGAHADAALLFRKVLERHPDDAVALNGLGLALKGTGELDEAVAVLRRAAVLLPMDAALRSNLGNVLRAAGQAEQALAAYREALVLDTGQANTHYNTGVVLEDLRRGSEALAAYREAGRLDPRHIRALTRIGALLHDQRRYADALAVLDQALAVDDAWFDARYYRGRALSAAGQHDEAIAELARTVEQRPSSFEAAYAHALALRDAARHDEALAALTTVTERWPDQVQAHVELNRLAWTRGRRAVFLTSFKSAKRAVVNPELLIAEASFRLRLNQYAEAERLLREAELLAPRRGDVAGLLARALAGQGRFVDSVELFAKAIQAEPRELRHRQELGFALLKMGQPVRAAEAFVQALRIDKYDQLALAGLTMALREQNGPHRDLVDPRRDVALYDLFDGESDERRAAFHAELAEELRRLHTMEVEPIDQSLHGGTQTSVSLFDLPLPAVAELRRRVERAVGDFIGRMPLATGHPFAGRKTAAYGFTGSWSCRLKPGGYHSNHVHPAGWISSAYYVALPASTQDASGHSGWLAMGQSNLSLGARDLPELLVQPRVGRLVLFPSYCWHGTLPFADAAERLAVAFDVVPVSAPAA